MGREIAYMLVQHEQIKDKFPYVTVLDDGRAIIPLAKADMLIGVSGIEIKGSHEVEALVASIGLKGEEEESSEAEESAEEEASQQEDNNETEEEDES